MATIATDDSQGISNEELASELQRRSAALRAGTTTARPSAEVLADLRRWQAGEASS